MALPIPLNSMCFDKELLSATTSAATSEAGSTANTPGTSTSPISPFFSTTTPTTPPPSSHAHAIAHPHSLTDTTSSPSRAHLTHRTVCCSIPVCTRTSRILMVTSRKHHDKWIFPKGGLEKGETLVEAAVRESWEEAGTREGMGGYRDWRVGAQARQDEAPAESSTSAHTSSTSSTSTNHTSARSDHLTTLSPPTTTDSRDPWTAKEVYQATSRSGNGQREIRYHVFEIEIDGDDLPEEWPESSQRKRELVTVPEVIRRCVAWRNEKNTKLELVDGFRQTSVYKKWKERVERGEVEGPPRSSNSSSSPRRAGQLPGQDRIGEQGLNQSPGVEDDGTEDEVARAKSDLKAEEKWALAQEFKDEGLFRVGGEGRIMNEAR